MSYLNNKEVLFKEQKINCNYLAINKSSQHASCKFCQKPMKKQLIGSNIIYYCKYCGCVRSN